jgi:hypothetical protein
VPRSPGDYLHDPDLDERFSDDPAHTYRPLPFSSADFRRLKKTVRDRAPHLELDLYHTDTGEPFVSVTDPGITTDADPIIIRGEITGLDGSSKLGWRMHRGGEGPLYEFATERAVGEFFCAGGLGEL